MKPYTGGTVMPQTAERLLSLRLKRQTELPLRIEQLGKLCFDYARDMANLNQPPIRRPK